MNLPAPQEPLPPCPVLTILAPAEETTVDWDVLHQGLATYEKSLVVWIQRHTPRSMNTRFDPEDILQEIRVKAQRTWSRFPKSGLGLRVWLVRLARDCLVDRIRHECADIRGRDQETDSPVPVADTGTSPSGKLHRKELRERVQQVLRRLSPADQRILKLREWEGLPYDEIARRLGTTEPAVRQQHRRALERFGGLWGQNGE